MSQALLNDLKGRMEKSMSALEKDLGGLRTGRASADLLAPITVDAYGSKMPLSQTGNVSVVDASLLSVTVWDATLTSAVEKAIRESSLGLNPSAEGNVIRVPLPQLTEERRKELLKVARGFGENSRVAIRNVRRDGMDAVKKMEKDSEISEDEARNISDEIQKLTDTFVKNVDTYLEKKEKDIMKV